MNTKATKLICAFAFSILLGIGTTFGQITIDGVSNEANYRTLATYTSGNDGFGSTNNIDEINYFADGSYIYIGIPADLGGNDNIVLWMDFSGYGGQPAGGIIGESGENGIFGTGGFDGAKIDMEADFGFAFNEGNGTSSLFLDAARYGSTGIIFKSSFVGQSDQSGTSASIPSSNIADLFDSGTIDMAYSNAGTSGAGIELRIDISNIPGVDSTQTVKFFAAIASSGGFMSNEFIPSESYVGGNLGDDADIGSLTGDYFTSTEALQITTTITGTEGWRLLSLPITGGTIEDVSDDSPVQGVTGGSNPSDDANFYTYDDTGSFEVPASVSTAFGDGYGFAMYFFDNSDAGSSELPLSLDVSGSEPVINVTANLYSGATGRYTLVGNPFASNYNLNNSSANGAIGSNVSFWDNSAGSYVSQSATDGGGFIVAPFQGFFVVTGSATTSTYTFNTSGKTSSDTSGTYFKSVNANNADISFSITSNYNTEKNLKIQIRKEALEGWDNWDLPKLGSLLQQNVSGAFTGNLEGKTITKAIESLPLNLDKEIILPLFVTLTGETQEVKMSWKGISDAPDSWDLFLEDYSNGTRVNLRTTSEYIFTELGISSSENAKSVLNPGLGEPMKLKSGATNRFGIIITPSTTVGIDDEVTGAPTKFALNQNYPNPFNPATTITYSVGESGPVNITVYNVMGRKVAELVNTTKSAGNGYQVSWDATAQASGIYYYRLTAPGQVLTRQMTLIK